MQATTAKNVRIIEPTLTLTGRSKTVCERINTGAYARVSTEKDEQEQSYERQQEYYERYIKSRSDWNFVEVYADDATGTRTDKRPNFLRMIADAKAGKLDKILVKSVARFGRSTVDTLKYIRELKEHGVSVYFENENIDTMTPGGEVLLTILAGMAEQESRTISSNIKWAYQKKFEGGGFILRTDVTLGYTRDKDKNIIIEPNEALVVQRVFKEFLSGSSTGLIAEGLEADAIPTPKSKGAWRHDTVMCILKNIAYTGDVIMGKSYKPDVLSPRRVKNKGQRQLFYIENSHPAIISKETYELAQAEFMRRNSLRSHGKSGKGRYSSLYALSGYLYCGECGAKLRKWGEKTNGGEKRTTWMCTNRERFGKDACSQFTKKDEHIKDAFLRMLNGQLRDFGSEFFRILRENITAEVNSDYLSVIDEIDAKITELQQEALRVNKENRLGILSNVEYDTMIEVLEKQLATLRAEKSEAVVKNEKLKLAEFRLQEIERVLTGGMLHKFDDDLFRNLIERATLVENTITFQLLSGLEFSEQLDAPAEVAVYDE